MAELFDRDDVAGPNERSRQSGGLDERTFENWPFTAPDAIEYASVDAVAVLHLR